MVAVGGNSLIRDPERQTFADQYQVAAETDRHIGSLIADGWEVAITHGNGPQVGFALRRSELAADELPELPLDVCGADTQGEIGYILQQNLVNDLRRRRIGRAVVTVITQTEVDPLDPAFDIPTKPIGSFLTADEAHTRRRQGWTVVEDAGRGWRRVVPSPRPVRIIEAEPIRRLLDSGFVVIAVGGGGIPVVVGPDGTLSGVAAVIDKDLAAALLALDVEAEVLAICTSVERVALDYGTPQARWLDSLTLAEAKAHLEEGTHFPPGSMGPKIEAAIAFLEGGGREAVITDAENLAPAVAGQAGTRIS